MSTHQADQITPVADELRQARERMLPNERALGDALLDLAELAYVAYEQLSALIDRDELEPLLGPIAEQLFASGRSAVGAHAAVVARINRAVMH